MGTAAAASAVLVLSTTRAVRRRLDTSRPVDLDVVRACLQLASQAPSGGAAERARWVVVTDPGVRADAAQLYRACTREAFAAAHRDAATDSARRAYAGAQHLASILHLLPVLVFSCGQGTPPGRSRHALAGFYGSVIPAVWSLQLALRAHGLGSSYTTGHLRDEDGFARLLGIPDDVTQVAMLPVAHTLGTEFTPARRRPVDDISFGNRWGAPLAR